MLKLSLQIQSSLEQLKENTDTMKNAKYLNGEEHKIIKEVSEILNSNIVVNCTKGRYCIDSYPQLIDIASIFDIYNKHKMLNISSWISFGNVIYKLH